MKNKENYKHLVIKLNSLLDEMFYEAETKSELESIYNDIVFEADVCFGNYEDEVPEHTEEELESMNWPDTMENLGIRLGDFM